LWFDKLSKELIGIGDTARCFCAIYEGGYSERSVYMTHEGMLQPTCCIFYSNSSWLLSSARGSVFNGLVTTDIVVEKPSSDGSGRLIKVSIEYDGPTHYLRPAMGSRDRVGPIDAKTRLRNALLKKCNEFEVLITIPYYEWNEAPLEGGRRKRST